MGYLYIPRYQEDSHQEDYRNTDFALLTWSWAWSRTPIGWFGGNGYRTGETSNEGPCICALVSFKVCLDQNQGCTQIDLLELEHNDSLNIIVSIKYPSLIGIYNAVPGRLLFQARSALLGLRNNYGCYDDGSDYHRLNTVNRDGATLSDIGIEKQWVIDAVKRNPYSRSTSSNLSLF